jgi:hypothetical protein
MEAIFILALLVALALAAPRWGRDSRQRLDSKEFDLAMHGVVWPRPAQGSRVGPAAASASAGSNASARA